MEYPQLREALTALEECDGEGDCEGCPIGKKVMLNAHDAGVWFVTTVCSALQVVDDLYSDETSLFDVEKL